MSGPMIAVLEEGFAFDVNDLATTLRSRWPSTPYVPATGRMATVNLGQFQVPDARESFPRQVLIEVDIEGRALDISSPIEEFAAEVIAAITHVPGLPADGTVVLAEWAADFLPLRPGMTKEEVLALLG